ncbi:MAG TPA: Fur family transcriptional regulator [Planctomycetia bacterium]|nr:Fur family transcriptional regulator [Planctomycetia bacterium]
MNAAGQADPELPQDGRSLTPSMARVKMALSPVAKFREFLDLQQLKVTGERMRIVEHIFEEHQHFDAEQLLASLKAKGLEESRPTVYRTLKLLVDAGLLRKLDFGGATAYEHDYGYPHHEHLYCEQCGGVIEFVDPELDALLERIARERRFRPTSRTLVVQGVCESCAGKLTRRRKLDMI